jgi:hypothetical protein
METTYPNISTCTEHMDCSPYLTNRLCVAEAHWLEGKDPECQCNHFYGFMPSEPGGVVCDRHSAASYVSMLMYASFTVYNLVHVFVCSVYLVRSFLASEEIRKRKSSRILQFQNVAPIPQRRCRITLSAVQFTALLMLVSVVCAFGVGVFTFLNFAVIEGVPPAFAINGKDGFGRYEIYTRTLLTISGLCGQLGAFNLCIAWMEVANETDAFLARKNKLSTARRVALALELFVVLCCLAGVIVESMTGIKIIAFLGGCLQPIGIVAQAGMHFSMAFVNESRSTPHHHSLVRTS